MQGGLQLRHIDMDSLARAAASVQSGKYGGNGKPGNNKVGIRTVGIDRVTVRPTGQVGQSHQRRKHWSEAGLAFHGSAATHHGSTEKDYGGGDLF